MLRSTFLSAVATRLSLLLVRASLCAVVLLVPFAAQAEPAPAAGKPNVEQLLATIDRVGHEAEGNDQARAAWKQLAQSDPAQLPRLLEELDRANPLAANWIRSAIESIATRAIQTPGGLPTAGIEKFLANRENAPRARRLAYELLVLADPGTPDKLLPNMLDDPSVELRRDAVARLLNEAKELFEKDDRPRATEVFQKALAAARDLDQVRTAEEKLKTLGQTVDLVRHFGLLTHWKLIGPFDNTATSGFDKPYPPEEKIEADAKYEGKGKEVAWMDFVTTDPMGAVDLNETLGKASGVAGYASCDFVAREARPIEIRLSTVNAAKIWLNGKLLATFNVYHAGEEFDQYAARGELRAGVNHILVKVCQNEMTETWAQDWKFQVRVCDSVGTAVLSDEPKSAQRDDRAVLE